MRTHDFPKKFIFGAATSAFQIEGARAERGDSVWDEFCTQRGRVKDASNGDVACEHCERYREDVALMQEIGVQAYRFSIAWPRVMPEGIGRVNEKGLDFYDRLVDRLLESEITPYATLYHWDLPLALHRRGGWLNPEIAEWFYEYAMTVGARLGDRVKNFMTLNEPQCFIPYGYRLGIHAPGYRVGDKLLLGAIHNALRAHGAAVGALRQTVKGARIGVAMAADADYPATDAKEDIDAAKRELMSLKPGADAWMTNIVHWCDPIYLGDYPRESYERFGEDMPIMTEADRKLIWAPLDFHGQNVYSGTPVESDGAGGWRMAQLPQGHARNTLGWAVTPRAIRFVVKGLYERYHTPIYITENGICCNDWVHEDGRVHDAVRVDFMRKYLAELSLAIREGADVRGYFAWSLLDNFEWADGYCERFGLVYVDYATQKRILKDSAYEYQALIARHKNGKVER